jgi:hypothetical protein
LSNAINAFSINAKAKETYDKKHFVRMVYLILLKREPEVGAIENTIPRFNENYGPGDFLDEVSRSHEYKSLWTNNTYVNTTSYHLCDSNHNLDNNTIQCKDSNTALSINQIMQRISLELGNT